MAVSNDTLTDQRVARHRRSLEQAGYDVVLIGLDQLHLRHHKGWRFYAELNQQLYTRLRQEQADIVWANDSDTLIGCYRAAHCAMHTAYGKRPRLVMDAHELFPEVPEIQHKPLVKWVWRTVERLLMPRCDARLTVCHSIAHYYQEHLGVQMEVVRNLSDQTLPPQHATPPAAIASTTAYADVVRFKSTCSHLLIYQGCINMGRGVDWAIDALAELPDCGLLIVGGGDLEAEMRAYAATTAWSHRIHFTGKLLPDLLHHITPLADVGLVMLEDMGLSYHYALPNRIADFVAAGVPMVVSNLPEMASVVRRFGVGDVMHATGAHALADSVQRVLGRTWSDADFAQARLDMDWNTERQTLSRIVAQLTSNTQ